MNDPRQNEQTKEKIDRKVVTSDKENHEINNLTNSGKQCIL